MRELLAREADRAAGAEEERLSRERAELSELVASLEGRMGRLADALSRGTLPDEQFKEANGRLLAERSEARARLGEAEAALGDRERRAAWARRVRAAALDFPRLWGHLHLEERCQVLSLLLETLTVDRDGKDSGGSGGKDFRVRLKVHLLPERVVTLMLPNAARLREKPSGLASLTPRHLALLYHLGPGQGLQGQQGPQQGEEPQGRPRGAGGGMTAAPATETARLKAAGGAMGVSVSTARSFAGLIKKRLGVAALSEAEAMARGRVRQLLPTLPLGPQRPQGSPGREEGAAGEGVAAAPLLSPKLLEVLPLLARGAKGPDVARLTGLPKTTVAGRRAEIRARLGGGRIYEAAEKARALGIL
jgi:hypothetical protein